MITELGRSKNLPLTEKEDKMETRLSELKPGDKGIISRVTGDRELRRRLLDMGLTRGTEITVIRRAPLGDPVEFLLIHPDSSSETPTLGPDIAAGMSPQLLVPAGTWQGFRLAPGGAFALTRPDRVPVVGPSPLLAEGISRRIVRMMVAHNPLGGHRNAEEQTVSLDRAQAVGRAARVVAARFPVHGGDEPLKKPDPSVDREADRIGFPGRRRRTGRDENR